MLSINFDSGYDILIYIKTLILLMGVEACQYILLSGDIPPIAIINDNNIYMSYTIDPNEPTIAIVTPSSTIDDIISANPYVSTFKFPAGNFYLTDILKIDINNITFIGMTSKSSDVHIFQNNDQKDGLDITANNFLMRYISVHVTYDNKIALTVADASNTSIQNCYFYGNKTTFSVYYAGPRTLTQGQSTINGYNNNKLDMNNTFTDNVIYSEWSGDCVSFSLQIKGLVNRNIIRGGKLAIYMCKKCTINNNIIYDSIGEGIHISLPSETLNIISNKIYECDTSGIKISNQLEHGSFVPKKCDITIKNNYIYDSKFNAIELNDTIGCVIVKNKLISTENFGIYVLRSTNVSTYENKISYFSVAIWLEGSSHCNIYKNLFMSVYPDEGSNVVKLTIDSNNNNIYDNLTKGHILYDNYIIPSQTTGNLEYHNTHVEYYDMSDEINVMK